MIARPKILLVGSDPHISILRRQILEREGYSVTVTDSVPDESLLHLESVGFDCVILGHCIPSQHRAELAAKIRARHPRLPILAIFQFPGELDKTANKFIYSLDGPEAMLQALKEIFSDLSEDQPDSANRKNRARNNSIN